MYVKKKEVRDILIRYFFKMMFCNYATLSWKVHESHVLQEKVLFPAPMKECGQPGLLGKEKLWFSRQFS